MIKIGTLGPKGTFSELATSYYINKQNLNGEIYYYNTFLKVFESIKNKEVDYIIVPIENTLDGFVQQTLDLMLNYSLKVLYDLYVPVQFSFVGNSLNLSEIKTVYGQFKTQGQCQRFLSQFDDVNLITTESNSTSYNMVKKSITNEGAIIPKHLCDKITKSFDIKIDNVTDYDDNKTRFIVLGNMSIEHDANKKCTTSIAITDSADTPGALFRIINEFAIRNLNLKYIMSRPSKKNMGRYIFFIDIEGSFYKDENLAKAIKTIKLENEVKVLGVSTSLGIRND